MRVLLIFLSTLALLSVACSKPPPGCLEDSDCPPGRHCRQSECQFDCVFDPDCPEGFRCTERGRCERGCVKSNGGLEACDGLDNDCDTDTDEDFGEIGSACSFGSCPAGVLMCAVDGLSAACTGRQAAADDASCDDFDDDCDGQIDEDASDRDCPLQLGVCAGVVESCLAGGLWSGCEYGPMFTDGLDEVCDQFDNDCDGQTDEDALTLLIPEAGDLGRDGLDNNCNGLVDEAGGIMVPVPGRSGLWIDSYEATVFTNSDCTGTRFGESADDYPAGFPAEGDPIVTLYACSLPGLVPSAYLSWYRAQWVCEAQGKRLCQAADWEMGCSGMSSSEYPYGLSFAPGACNDYTGSGQSVAGGTYDQCRSDIGVFDASGNLAEWLAEWGTGDSCPTCARTGGFAFRCELCYDYGSWCVACDPDDPEHWHFFGNGYDCPATGNWYELYRRHQALDILGTRCCYSGP